VIKNGVVPASEASRLADTMKWKYAPNFVTKDQLAFIDILAHNNWKRPICFTITVGGENMMGLQPYLYKEGFTYHLIPFKPDTATRDQLGKTNDSVMYDNMMNKFKWGNFKTAKYLDPESTTMFYPVMTSTFTNLIQNIKLKDPDKAKKLLKLYDDKMPDIYPYVDMARSKYFLVANAYDLGDITFANKYASSIDAYLADQMDYSYSQLQSSPDLVDPRSVQLSLYVLNQLSELAKQNHQAALATKLEGHFKNYESKFQSLIGGPAPKQ
jgi:hypothetical protein